MFVKVISLLSIPVMIYMLIIENEWLILCLYISTCLFLLLTNRFLGSDTPPSLREFFKQQK